MNDDTISREAALAEVTYLCEDCPVEFYMGPCPSQQCDVRIMREALENLPPAQPGWIPVTERLPKPNEYENDVRVYYLVQNEYGDMMVCSWHGSYWTRMYRSTKVKDKVVAWMPLPTPYREGGQDGE